MEANKVHSKMQNFVNIPVSYNFFMEQLKDSNQSNKILCWYTTEEGTNRRYSMYWDSAAYVGNEASLTKEDNDMYNLQGEYPDGDWRTLDTTTVSKFRYKNKTYIIK
jgi:hypothetical protein